MECYEREARHNAKGFEVSRSSSPSLSNKIKNLDQSPSGCYKVNNEDEREGNMKIISLRTFETNIREGNPWNLDCLPRITRESSRLQIFD